MCLAGRARRPPAVTARFPGPPNILVERRWLLCPFLWAGQTERARIRGQILLGGHGQLRIWTSWESWGSLVSQLSLASRKFPPGVSPMLAPRPRPSPSGSTPSPSQASPPEVLGWGRPSAQVHPLLKLVHGALALGDLVWVGSWEDTPLVSPALGFWRRESCAPWPARGATLPAIGLGRLLPTPWDPRALRVRAAWLRGWFQSSLDTIGFHQRLALDFGPLGPPLCLLAASAIPLPSGLGLRFRLGEAVVGRLVVFAGGDVL